MMPACFAGLLRRNFRAEKGRNFGGIFGFYGAVYGECFEFAAGLFR